MLLHQLPFLQLITGVYVDFPNLKNLHDVSVSAIIAAKSRLRQLFTDEPMIKQGFEKNLTANENKVIPALNALIEKLAIALDQYGQDHVLESVQSGKQEILSDLLHKLTMLRNAQASPLEFQTEDEAREFFTALLTMIAQKIDAHNLFVETKNTALGTTNDGRIILPPSKSLARSSRGVLFRLKQNQLKESLNIACQDLKKR